MYIDNVLVCKLRFVVLDHTGTMAFLFAMAVVVAIASWVYWNPETSQLLEVTMCTLHLHLHTYIQDPYLHV